MYFNIGTDIKYGTSKNPGEPKKAAEMNYEELKEIKEECRKKYGAID